MHAKFWSGSVKIRIKFEDPGTADRFLAFLTTMSQ